MASSAEIMLRPAEQADEPFMRRMCYFASMLAAWQDDPPHSQEEILGFPLPDKYVGGWKRSDDIGHIAIIEGRSAGAIWYRPLTEYVLSRNGIIEKSVPENMICLGVERDRRGEGIGTALMDGMLATARVQGLQDIALTSDKNNAGANRLYRHAGFEQVAADQTKDKSFIVMTATL